MGGSADDNGDASSSDFDTLRNGNKQSIKVSNGAARFVRSREGGDYLLSHSDFAPSYLKNVVTAKNLGAERMTPEGHSNP